MITSTLFRDFENAQTMIGLYYRLRNLIPIARRTDLLIGNPMYRSGVGYDVTVSFQEAVIPSFSLFHHGCVLSLVTMRGSGVRSIRGTFSNENECQTAFRALQEILSQRCEGTLV
jgi:hypothetical protein